MINKMKQTISGLIVSLALLPLASAYSYGPLSYMYNLWDVFVEQMFASFWPAVLFIAFIFLLILMIGGISFYTVIIFEAYFFLAMAIGYGYPIVVFPLLVGSVIYLTWQLIKLFLENR